MSRPGYVSNDNGTRTITAPGGGTVAGNFYSSGDEYVFARETKAAGEPVIVSSVVPGSIFYANKDTGAGSATTAGNRVNVLAAGTVSGSVGGNTALDTAVFHETTVDGATVVGVRFGSTTYTP